MAGFITRKLGTVKIWMRARTRRQARKVVHFGATAKDQVEAINHLILDHEVTEAIDAREKFIARLHEFFEADFHVALDVEFQEDKALELIAKIEEILLHITEEKVTDEDVHKFLDFMRMHLEQSTGAGIKLDQKEMKELMTLIAQLDKSHTTFMADIKTMTKDMDISQLARLPFYRDIRKEKMDLNILKQVLDMLTKIEAHIKGGKFEEGLFLYLIIEN